jgi:uncharacterized protein (DUF1800 family)
MADAATRSDVARLFGRAAFGATRADLAAWEGRPYADAVDSLFPPGPPGASGRLPQADEAERLAAEHYTETLTYGQQWWLERMRTTPYPLEERLTLFWHDHFATGYVNPPDTGHLMVQNQTLRMNALGSFRDLANAMTIDVAMLFWLNGIASSVYGVNENYAREFLELFALGVFPQVYTETDIRQAGRAFSGWTVNTGARVPVFTEARQVPGPKTVLGRTIGGYPPGDARKAAEYREVTEAALAWDGGRTASRFLAYKLVIELGYQPNEADLASDPVVEDVAAALRAGDAWSIRAGVRTLLLHPGWRYAPALPDGLLVRSPVELLVHGAKVLGVSLSYTGGGMQSNTISAAVARAGQDLLLPPSVGGWPNGVGWLSQTTNLGRYELFNLLSKQFRDEQRTFVTPWPASGDLAGWAAFMGLPGLTTSTTLRLQEYLASPGTLVELDKQSSMFLLVGSSPDWQVM